MNWVLFIVCEVIVDVRLIEEVGCELVVGEICLVVCCFVLMVNNIIYVVFGMVMCYWEFFLG